MFSAMLGTPKSHLVSQLKQEISSNCASLSNDGVAAIAEYRAQILQCQDPAQVAYLKVFKEASSACKNPLELGPLAD